MRTPTPSRLGITLAKMLIVAAAFTAVFATACSNLTDINNPGVVQPSAENNATGAAARYAGAQSLFVNAMANQLGVVASVGLITDEFLSGNLANNAGGIEADERRLPETYTQFGGYAALQSARVNLETASAALQQFAPQPPARIGNMLALTGYTELFLAEDFCAGIPFSAIVDGVEQDGQPTTTADVNARAVVHFDSAVTFSADSARILNLARVGKGRALLDVGKFADAAAAVNAVPTSFVYNIETSSLVAAQNNALFSRMAANSGYGVPDREGTNGLDYRSASDPRVPTVFSIKGLDNVTDLYRFTKVTSTATPIVLASGIEARLLEAEAALQANNNDTSPTGSGWLGILNSLRATAITPAMPALADPGSYSARVTLLFRERAFWLFLTGHRLGDMRRLIRQYGRPANTVFPSGTYKDGLPYGSDVNYPIGTNDGQNPFFKGCTNRDA